jgi:NADH dehydrogenase
MLLVIGATGRLGGAVTRMLLAQGRTVRILVRHDSGAEDLAAQGLATSPRALVEAGAQRMYGDLKDRASIEAACDGVEAVVTTANAAARGGADTPQSVDLEGNRTLIDAAAAAGVGQFVFVSAQIADPESPVPFLRAKGLAEQHLRASGMSYTIVAPNAFMDVWLALVVGLPALAGRPVRIVGSGERRHSFVAAHDVAQFVVAALDSPRAVNARLVIGGPQAVSFRDAAAIFGRVLGRDVAVESVGPGDAIPGLPDTVRLLLPGFDLADTAIPEASELAATFGIALTDVETFARQMVHATA